MTMIHLQRERLCVVLRHGNESSLSLVRLAAGGRMTDVVLHHPSPKKAKALQDNGGFGRPLGLALLWLGLSWALPLPNRSLPVRLMFTLPLIHLRSDTHQASGMDQL
jgi:hypothetical protein